MNKKLIFLIEFIIVILIVFLAIFFLSKKLGFGEEDSYAYQEEQAKACEIDEDCIDDKNCTIDSCSFNFCSNVEIILCYSNDGCCPPGCNTNTDNDCRK